MVNEVLGLYQAYLRFLPMNIDLVARILSFQGLYRFRRKEAPTTRPTLSLDLHSPNLPMLLFLIAVGLRLKGRGILSKVRLAETTW